MEEELEMRENFPAFLSENKHEMCVKILLHNVTV